MKEFSIPTRAYGKCVKKFLRNGPCSTTNGISSFVGVTTPKNTIKKTLSYNPDL